MLRNEASMNVMLRNEASINVMLRNEASINVMLRNEASINVSRIITATIKNQAGRQRENSMVNSIDISPLFLFSNLDNWEEIGAIYSKQSRDKILVTPDMIALANKITGNKQGIEAARAIYNWVAQNIQYVAIYLNESAGYVPNSSSDVLQNGYGDCKDHVVLMQALLKAKGIDAYAVLVDWGDIYEKLPLPAPHFNHAMIYLPAYKIFANPTAHDAAFGELDTSLSGKFVVIASDKVEIAYTPKTTAEQNRYTITNTIKISADGSINGEAEMKFFGDIDDSTRSYFNSDTPEQIANQLLSSTSEGGTGWIEKNDINFYVFHVESLLIVVLKRQISFKTS
ncbi:transglutaminase-like domain-containing protein [Dulcicalothrix desertica]|nr:transglutaminase-like domain-containing protein [Dulcicalothrix desertica]